MALDWEYSEDLEEGTITRWARPRLMLSLCSAWSQLCNLQPLCLTLLRFCDKNGWFFPRSSSFPSKSQEKLGVVIGPDSGQRCVTVGIPYTASPPFSCPLSFPASGGERLWRPGRRGKEPQMEGIWVVKWHVKCAHTPSSLWIGNTLSLWWTIDL